MKKFRIIVLIVISCFSIMQFIQPSITNPVIAQSILGAEVQQALKKTATGVTGVKQSSVGSTMRETVNTGSME